MAAGYFHERRRLAAVFIVGGLVAIALVGGALWQLASAAGGGREAMLTGGVALAGIAAALALIWARLDRSLLLPLERLERELDTLLHADPGRALDLPEPGLLGPVIARMERLIVRGDRAGHEISAAIAAATDRLDDEKSRLAAVLRDLSEGVLVCTTDHRILLFNDAARRTLADGDRLGVGQTVETFLDIAAVAQGLADFTARDRPDIALLDLPGPGAVRMAPVLDAGGAVEGYVLSFPGTVPEVVPAPGAERLPPRPVVYDFEILSRPVSTERAGQALADLDFVVFDTETTGLRADRGDRIIQLGAVRVSSGRTREQETFDTLVNPGRPIPAASTRFHGLTDEDVADAPTAAEALKRFHAFCGGSVLVAQNAAFDMRFLRKEQAAAGVAFEAPVLDTMLLSFVMHPKEADHTLDGLAARYGVEIAARHTALGDSLITAAVLCRMIPLLAASGIETLEQAIEASKRAAPRFGAE